MKQPLLIAVVVVVALAAVGFAVLSARGARDAPRSCPEAAQYSPELSALPTAELERRLLSMRVLPPSGAKAQVEQTKAAAQKLPEADRACAYQSELVRLIVLGRHMGEVGETWGQTRELAELKQLMLEAPFETETTPAQRARLLELVETKLVPHGQMGPDDADYWRRMYLGVVLLCQVTPEERKLLHARKPMRCPGTL